jgi:NitT/TauT family transport system permease protein
MSRMMIDAIMRSLNARRGSSRHRRQRARTRWFAIRGELSRRDTWFLLIVGLSLPLVAWSLISASGIVPPVFMPNPLQVLRRMSVWIAREDFGSDLVISVTRVNVGFLTALVLALPLGLLAGTFRPAQVLLEPLMDFIRYMPAVAFIPLVMLWCGIGEGSKTAIIFIGTFFQMVLMMADDVRRVPLAQIEAAQTLGADRREMVSRVIFRSAAPDLLTTCRITLGWAWTYLVVAEIVAANAGIGYAILKAQRFLQTDKIFAGILVIGLIGLIQDQLLRALHRWLFPYIGDR